MTVAHDTLASVPAFGLKLDRTKPLLYKYYLSSKSLVPPGIQSVPRFHDAVYDRKNTEEAIERGDRQAAMPDRIRHGRKDTGNCVYGSIGGVRVGSARSLLALAGYRVRDVQQFELPGRNTHVAQIALGFAGKSCALSWETVEGFRRLARENTWTVSVFDNFKDQTINFRSRQLGGKPKFDLVVREGYLRLVDVVAGQDALELEHQEELASAEEIERLLKSFMKQM